MSAYQVIKGVIAVGLIIGGVSFCLNEKWRSGMKFQEGFSMAGRMFLSIAGIMTIAPVLAGIIRPILTPLIGLIGADPAVFGSFLGCDMGGYALARSLAESKDVANMMGLAPAAMLGGTLTFSIPVAKALLSEEDFVIYSKGILIGLLAIPFGSMAGGQIQGIGWDVIFINHIPVILLSLLLILGFVFFRENLVRAVDLFGKMITKIGLIGIIAGGVTHLTGIPVIPGMPPLLESMETVCGMVLTLAGTLPLLDLFNRVVDIPLKRIGSRAGLGAADMSGLLFTLASGIPTFAMMKDMGKRGIVMNAAWNVACVGLMGSQLGFVLQEVPEMLVPFAGAKLVSGILALALAFAVTGRVNWNVVDGIEEIKGGRKA